MVNEKYEMDAKEAMIQEAKEYGGFEKTMEAKGYKKCDMCNYWVLEEDLTFGICDSCVDNIITKTTLSEAIEYADKTDDLYTFVTDYLFNAEQIKSILVQEAKKALEVDKSIFSKDIKEYIENDVCDYLDYLKEKGEI